MVCYAITQHSQRFSHDKVSGRYEQKTSACAFATIFYLMERGRKAHEKYSVLIHQCCLECEKSRISARDK